MWLLTVYLQVTLCPDCLAWYWACSVRRVDHLKWQLSVSCCQTPRLEPGQTVSCGIQWLTTSWPSFSLATLPGSLAISVPSFWSPALTLLRWWRTSIPWPDNAAPAHHPSTASSYLCILESSTMIIIYNNIMYCFYLCCHCIKYLHLLALHTCIIIVHYLWCQTEYTIYVAITIYSHQSIRLAQKRMCNCSLTYVLCPT